MSKRLTKSSTNIVLTGTLAGIGEYFNIDPTIVRIIYAVFAAIGVGAPVLLYILLALVIPKGTHHERNKPNFYQNGTYYNRNQQGKRKEAEKIKDDEDWSDF